MATGFVKIYYHVHPAKFELVFHELVAFFESEGILLKNEKGLVECMDAEVEPLSFHYHVDDLMTILNRQEEVSFFWKVSDMGRLYCRFKWFDQTTLLEDYDFGWLPDLDERIQTSKLLVVRMKKLATYLGCLMGGLFDRRGHAENFDWDAFFVHHEIIGDIAIPSLICTKSDSFPIEDSDEVEMIHDFKFIYIESLDQ